MAEQNEKSSTPATDSGSHKEKDLSIVDYSKTYGGVSKRFSNVAKENMETPKPITIGRILIVLSVILLIWANFQPFVQAVTGGKTESVNYLSGDGILVIFFALLTGILMVFKNARKRTIITAALALIIIIVDLVNGIVMIRNNSSSDVTYGFGYGIIFLLIGAVVMVVGSLMILITDSRKKE